MSDLQQSDKPWQQHPVRTLHACVDTLAQAFKGYLPWPDDLRTSTVKGHERLIKDTLERADACLTIIEHAMAQRPSVAAPEVLGLASKVRAIADSIAMDIGEEAEIEAADLRAAATVLEAQVSSTVAQENAALRNVIQRGMKYPEVVEAWNYHMQDNRPIPLASSAREPTPEAQALTFFVAQCFADGYFDDERDIAMKERIRKWLLIGAEKIPEDITIQEVIEKIIGVATDDRASNG